MASRFCGECGSPIKPGARFCSECGWEIIQMSSNEGNYEQQMMPMKEFAQNQYNQYPGSYAGGPKTNKTKMIVIVSVIVLLTLAVFAGIKIFGGFGSPKEAKASTVNDRPKDTIAQGSQSILIGHWVTNSANDKSIFLKIHDGTRAEFYHKACMSEYKYKIMPDIIVLNDIYTEAVLELPYSIKSQDIIELYLDNEMSPYKEGPKEWIMFYREGTDLSGYMKDSQGDTKIGSQAEGKNQVDNMPIDTEMTNLLKEHWDYQAAYASESFSDLIVGSKLFSAEIKIGGKAQKMSFGLIRFSGGMDGFSYAFYAYREGMLYISFDPLMGENTFEKFVIVG